MFQSQHIQMETCCLPHKTHIYLIHSKCQLSAPDLRVSASSWVLSNETQTTVIHHVLWISQECLKLSKFKFNDIFPNTHLSPKTLKLRNFLIILHGTTMHCPYQTTRLHASDHPLFQLLHLIYPMCLHSMEYLESSLHPSSSSFFHFHWEHFISGHHCSVPLFL